ncbi:MAG: FlgO family outer membrane protein [Elusimicrobia bacterium]|nr:FlgO family outer membrane protein [Elusimicrobiota bacterium]
MKINNCLAFLACFVFLAGCGKNIKDGKITNIFAPDPYERLAEKISDGHKYLSNKKVAVLPFSYTDKRVSTDGVVISERLLTRILNRRELEVIERGLLEKVLSELKLQHSGAIDENSIKGLGKILGVEAVVTGTLTKYRNGLIEINARLIKTESAAVLSAAAETVMPDWETAVVPAVTPAAGPVSSVTSITRKVSPTPVKRTNCPGGMVYYWNFDDVSGTVANDVFGGNSAWLNGPVPTMSGKVNSALTFEGNNYLKVSDWPGIKISKEVTIEAWVNYKTINFFDSGARIFCRSGSYCFIIGGPENHDSNLAIYMWGLSNPGWYRGNTRLLPNTWYHVAVTYDGSRITSYINGEIDSSFGAAGLLERGTNNAFIGWDPEAAAGYHAPLNGVIDEVAVYNRALNRSEIADHYNKGLLGKGYCAL